MIIAWIEIPGAKPQQPMIDASLNVTRSGYRNFTPTPSRASPGVSKSSRNLVTRLFSHWRADLRVAPRNLQPCADRNSA